MITLKDTQKKDHDTMDQLDRYHGSLLGLAIGDALGAPIEFRPPGTFTPITTFQGGGTHGLNPGQWTDDTSLALCLAESLIERQGFDPKDQMERYLQWYREGYLSSVGFCFDIGNTTRLALEKFEKTGNPFSGQPDPRSAGNGSLMRVAPVPLAFASDPFSAIHLSGDSSKTTHAVKPGVDACKYFGSLIVGALQGRKKDELVSPRFSPVEQFWEEHPLAREIDEIASGSFKVLNPPEIRSSGYVVKSLEAALWAFHQSDSFKEGCLLAVNLGDDADTVGAIYGQLAGAFYGIDGIPGEWKEGLYQRELIEGYAEKLFKMAY